MTTRTTLLRPPLQVGGDDAVHAVVHFFEELPAPAPPAGEGQRREGGIPLLYSQWYGLVREKGDCAGVFSLIESASNQFICSERERE